MMFSNTILKLFVKQTTIFFQGPDFGWIPTVFKRIHLPFNQGGQTSSEAYTVLLF